MMRFMGLAAALMVCVALAGCDRKDADAAGRITASEEKKLKDKYQDRIQKASQDAAREGMRIGLNPALMTPELKEAMQELSTINKK